MILTKNVLDGLRAYRKNEVYLAVPIHKSMAPYSRITFNPKVMGGKPCIRGMRVTVGTILGLLASQKTIEQILEAYPYLEREDIYEALAYAAWRTEERELPIGA